MSEDRWMLSIVSYNVNGLRAALRKGFAEWLRKELPTCLCLQEVKALAHELPLDIFRDLGYHCYWHAAEKRGYSGVAILSHRKPIQVHCGGLKETEGRVLRLDFDTFSLGSVYAPSGSSGELRQAFKMKWLTQFEHYVAQTLQTHPKLILCGDFNICHQPIDIHHPEAHMNTSGFLPEERAWMTHFLSTGFIDSFRLLNSSPHQYTWWTYRGQARQKNLGWRIDYAFLSQNLRHTLVDHTILKHITFSDHVPLKVELKSL